MKFNLFQHKITDKRVQLNCDTRLNSNTEERHIKVVNLSTYS